MKHKWWVLAAVACGTYMATLDASIVNIALPTLTKEFAADIAQVKWVVVVFLLVITCFLLPFGRLADIHGRKMIFVTGLAIFTGASALCGMAGSLRFLVFGRTLQGLGAAMLMANGPAIIAANFPASKRGSALGIMGMVVSMGLLSGPSLGGYLISHFSWRTIFWVNIPVGIIGIILASRHLKHTGTPRSNLPFDWAGAVLQFFILMLSIVLFDPPNISVSGSMPFAVPRTALVILLLGMTWIFINVERSVAAPLFDLSLLGNRTFWTANLASFLTFVAYSSVTVLTPFFFEEMMKFSTKEAGLYMTAIPLTILVIAPVSGRLSDRFGSHELGWIGATVGTLALFGMAGAFGKGVHPAIHPVSMVLFLVTVGAAIGLFQSPNNNAIMSSVPTEKFGIASAFLATVRNLGLVVGTGLATTLFTLKTGSNPARFHDRFMEGFRFALLVSGGVGIMAVLAAFGKKRGKNVQYEGKGAPSVSLEA